MATVDVTLRVTKCDSNGGWLLRRLSSGSGRTQATPVASVEPLMNDFLSPHDDTYTSGTLTEARHYYDTPGWQCVEERVGTSTTDWRVGVNMFRLEHGGCPAVRRIIGK